MKTVGKELSVAERQRLRVRAIGRAQTRLAKMYPGLYRKILAEEQEQVFKEAKANG